MIKKISYNLILLMLLFQTSNAQQLIESTELIFRLKDGSEINCYKSYSMNGETTNSYYYLPTNIHFSTTKSGDKSYSLIVYKDENEQILGGIMHWLVTWGLSAKQKEEVRLLIKSKVGSNAKFMGAVLPEKDTSKDDFEIIGTNKLSIMLNSAMVNKGNVPLIPNSKIAIAFKFTKEQAIKINDLFTNYKEKKATQISMRFLVSFKEINGRTFKKNIIITHDLLTLNKH